MSHLMPSRLQAHSDPDALVDAIIASVGRSIVLAIPLGLGKPNHIVNALVARAMVDPDLHLRIFTALTLERSSPSSELERRFLEPALDRLFGKYPPLEYAQMLRNGTLPANVEIDEFFFLAGRWRGVRRAQANYISANYTDVWRYILDRKVNLIAQLVAKREVDGEMRYSLSSNPDITAQLLDARAAGRADFMMVGQVNSELPYMSGEDVEVGEAEFAHMLDSPRTDFELYSAPKRPVALADHAVGLHVAGLVPDGGTLQIGIGAIGDAIAAGLLLRHRDNEQFRQLAAAVQIGDDRACPCEDGPFEAGLYGASEMLTDGFVQLEAAGVLKREVEGAVAHAAFFVECRDFYKTLREMPEAQRRRFGMRRVGFTNSLLGDVEKRREDRVKARFINSAMMVTLLGAVVSDATEDGQVVSGVGGQFDFVEQAFALEDARFILTINAVRTTRGKTVSNIVWSYGHTTVPRHLRDVVVTEYGVADLRGKSDGDVIAALLNIADSRFQDELLASAKAAGKIALDHEIPPVFRNNTPERLRAVLGPARASGVLPEFPFGTDFTPVEQRLMSALGRMKEASYSKRATAGLILGGAFGRGMRDDAALERMGLSSPAGPAQWIYRWMLIAALRDAAAEQAG
ncbi:acetyl-CoA hydrolase/transferase C-terminal domain-containing protein [Maricaulis sp.]|uniref:acetyl-CoA hydrolase/transferase C-terminal domain-containing protein n=1 Tax=Maricaulis sp. TaxID=1486257 RepID=UPI003A928AF2